MFKKSKSKTTPSSKLIQELEAMKELTMLAIKHMMLTGTLTAENLEIMVLETAAAHNFISAMTTLLTTSEADVNRTNPITGNTALHVASAAGHIKMVKLLVNYGAASFTNEEGKSPQDLSNAAQHKAISNFLNVSFRQEEEGRGAELFGEGSDTAQHEAISNFRDISFRLEEGREAELFGEGSDAAQHEAISNFLGCILL